MDATHFRQRAASARELAQSGDDIRLSRMLLDVALDLDAEAEAIELELLTRSPMIQSPMPRHVALNEPLLTASGARRKAG